MNVNKEAGVDCGLELSPEEMERINAMSKKKLEPGEVYAFAVRLCDNEIDRDNERFPAATLEELAPLFVGRSGLFDHQWSTRNQAARIYRTEVVRESWMTEAGEPYCYLKGCAYLLRTEGNRELIAAIEGGIKKEVSVGCAVKRAVCSICSTERGQDCGHKPGECTEARPVYFAGSMVFSSSSRVRLNAGSAAISSRRLLSFPSTLTVFPASMDSSRILSCSS